MPRTSESLPAREDEEHDPDEPRDDENDVEADDAALPTWFDDDDDDVADDLDLDDLSAMEGPDA